MADENCDCTSFEDDQRRSESNADRWIAEPTDDAALPADVRIEFGRFLDADGLETLGDLTDAFDRTVPIERDALCYADEPTPHRGVLDGETYHFECFYDAILLAELADAPVDVRTEAPDGTVVEARATGDGEVTVAPDRAVLSLGIRTDIDVSPDEEPTLEEGYAAICPAVKAFPSRSAYERWAKTVPAATIGTPVSAGATLAARLLG